MYINVMAIIDTGKRIVYSSMATNHTKHLASKNHPFYQLSMSSVNSDRRLLQSDVKGARIRGRARLSSFS